MNSYQS